MPTPLPISAIVPTIKRDIVLDRMLRSLAQQSEQPVEMIIVDASPEDSTERVCKTSIPGLVTKIVYRKARRVGAAVQRVEAMAEASQNHFLFCDDDITFEPECLSKLWKALETDESLGGVNAMIQNQQYSTPGRLSSSLFRVLNGGAEASYAGKCIGPGLNILPEDRVDLPEVVPVEWLNLGCTLYRRQAVPDPPFPTHLVGYSFLEDVMLSLSVGKEWKLANVRTARIFHDSQPGDHKNNNAALAKMELVNRHFVMTTVMDRRGLRNYLKLALLEVFGIVTPLVSMKNWTALPWVIAGKLKAIWTILLSSENINRHHSS